MQFNLKNTCVQLRGKHKQSTLGVSRLAWLKWMMIQMLPIAKNIYLIATANEQNTWDDLPEIYCYL